MLLYHGTNATNLIALMDKPMLKPSINGLGFYLTNELSVTQKYGRTVVVYDVSNAVLNTMGLVIRTIDQRHTEGTVSYAECALGGMEYVVTNKRDLDTLVLDADDVYTL